MKKRFLFAGLAVLVLGLAAGGYFWWTKSRQAAPVTAVQAVTDIQDTVDSINQRAIVDLYADTGSAEEATAIPDVNPYRNTNPFSDVKTNPFE